MICKCWALCVFGISSYALYGELCVWGVDMLVYVFSNNFVFGAHKHIQKFNGTRTKQNQHYPLTTTPKTQPRK